MSWPLSRSRTVRGIAICALILVSTAIVWHPIVFGGYTISDCAYARTDAPPYGADVMPVIDPESGSCQDEPWLALIGHAQRAGRAAR
jgi:hypothetical protein